MKKLIVLLALFVFASLPAMAQLNTSKIEVGGGYTFRSLDGLGGPRINMNGWNATAGYNVAGWLQLALDVDGAYGTVLGANLSQYTFFAGPRVYPLGHRKIAPFVHALAGISKFAVSAPGAAVTDSLFAFEVGGGVDAQVSKHISVRVGEVDFEQNRNLSNPLQNNFKFKAGVILRF
jgi:hypothetical protein